MRRGAFLSFVAFVVLATLWVTQCSGPRPVLLGPPSLQAPEQQGDAYRVEAAIYNSGLGHGEARATVRLVDVRTNAAYQAQTPVQLEAGETAKIVVDIPAPLGDYRPEVSVEYPPS